MRPLFVFSRLLHNLPVSPRSRYFSSFVEAPSDGKLRPALSSHFEAVQSDSPRKRAMFSSPFQGTLMTHQPFVPPPVTLDLSPITLLFLFTLSPLIPRNLIFKEKEVLLLPSIQRQVVLPTPPESPPTTSLDPTRSGNPPFSWTSPFPPSSDTRCPKPSLVPTPLCHHLLPPCSELLFMYFESPPCSFLQLCHLSCFLGDCINFSPVKRSYQSHFPPC